MRSGALEHHVCKGIREQGVRLGGRIDPGINEVLREHEGHAVVDMGDAGRGLAGEHHKMRQAAFHAVQATKPCCLCTFRLDHELVADPLLSI